MRKNIKGTIGKACDEVIAVKVCIAEESFNIRRAANC